MLQDVQHVCLDFLARSAESLNLLQGFSQRDITSRSEWSVIVQRILDSWYLGFGSPAIAGFLESYTQDRNGSPVDTTMHACIRDQIQDLVRISTSCPLQDVRETCENIIEDLKKKKRFIINVPLNQSPSYCFTYDEMRHLRCIREKPSEDDPLYTNYVLFCEHWYRWSCLENFIQLIGCHPQFLESFLKVHEHLFHGDLPMPYPDRHYLAILAAAELRCPQLVCLFARYFVTSGGNPQWHQGLQKGPARWRQLLSLNRNLAHNPWNITADHIYQLTRGDSQSGGSRETISLSELMHAVAIMTHTHSLACFIFGAGVRPELDHFNSNVSSHVAHGDDGSNGPTTSTNGKSTAMPVTPPTVDILLSLLREDSSDDYEDVEEDIATKMFMEVAKVNMHLTLPENFPLLKPNSININEHPVIQNFLQSSSSAYGDFKGAPFLVSEFSWTEEGCMLVDHLANNLGVMLDDTFQEAYELTYNVLNNIPNVDTARFRHAVWYFVQSLFGVCHDDFRFDRVDKFLSLEQRAIIKVCVTRPFDLCHHMDPLFSSFRSLFPALQASEIVHILIMMMEARQQAILSYALRAISQCQTRRG